MSDNNTGAITWVDLTVPDADKIKTFYAEVTGLKPEPVSMGGYNDYNMLSSEGKPVAGICNKRGVNENLPSQWMIYITVNNIEERCAKCKELGGKVIVEPKTMGSYGKYCVIEDPAGAVCALFEQA